MTTWTDGRTGRLQNINRSRVEVSHLQSRQYSTKMNILNKILIFCGLFSIYLSINWPMPPIKKGTSSSYKIKKTLY